MQLSGRKIALLQGGPGSEREVSLATGRGVRDALITLGAEVTDVDVRGADFTVPAGTYVAFNVIHGTFGEDGQIQTILEGQGVAYTGAGSASSARAFDKVISKELFVKAGVPTADYQVLDLRTQGAADIRFAVPFVAKPPREGSSVGVHIIRDAAQIAPALEDLKKFGNDVLIEPFISGKELTVGILGDQVLPVIHICPNDGVYDMANKYPWLSGKGGSQYFCPADLSAETTASVQAAALAAHRSLGVEVYSRVDVLLDAEERPFVLEVNTIPGMTSTSLLPKAARAAGIEYPELCARILELSLAVKR